MTATGSLDVLIIGAGFAGIGAAIGLRERGILNFRVCEKAAGIGGTWWHNVYPGAACDVPSHFYCYSFEPNPDWSRLYAPQPEIRAYIDRCAEKYGVLPHIEFGREIVGLTFDDARALWSVAFSDGNTADARFVIDARGGLHRPRIPEFLGAERFQGTTMHTGAWDLSFDPAGKRVAVIGSAASAIQVVPELARTATMVHLYQRTPNFIAPRNDFAYSEEQKAAFRSDPELMRRERERLFEDAETRFYPLIVDDVAREKMRRLLGLYLASQVRTRQMRAAMTPDYEVGCKRLLFSDDFLATLNADNVELVTAAIRELTATEIVTTDGEARPVDAIVYATGFDIEGHRGSIDIRGEGGLTLAAYWKTGVEAYRSVMVPGFPNYFMATGPNSGVGTTSIVFMIEQALGWIFRCIEKAGPHGTVSVTEEATADHNREIQQRLGRTVWASGCDSWYVSANGRIETLFPGNARDFREQMRVVEPGHLRIGTGPAQGARGR